MIRPPYLKPGDTVAIISTARKVVKAEVKPCVDKLKSWGLYVQFGKNLFKHDNQFSGSDEERAADFQRALNNKNISAILFARGGYGTVRIIDLVDFKRFIKNLKWLIGFSDITVVHSHVHRNCDVETLHAPMSLNIPKLNDASLTVLKNTLFGERLSYSSSRQQASLEKLNRKGKASGVLVGGNLSLLYSLAGSSSDIDTTGKILFLEDLDEYLYHIDRMMMNLKRSGKLQNLAGLVVGSMSEMKDNEIPFGKTAEEIIHGTVAEYNFPVVYGFPAGHIQNNFPLLFGREATLNVTDKMELTFAS
ncbi:MAG: LD-carboxypeptidase [Bacteroidetes bacterium]|nr:LD-carboxypeptidase [Bacteroidota bacterium]